MFIFYFDGWLDIFWPATSIIEENKLRCASCLDREAFDIHGWLGELGAVSIVKDASDLICTINKETSLSIVSTHKDSCSKHELISFVDLWDDGDALLEEEDKLDESHTIVSDKLIHLAFLWSNLLLFWLHVTYVWILDSLKWLGYILDTLYLE